MRSDGKMSRIINVKKYLVIKNKSTVAVIMTGREGKKMKETSMKGKKYRGDRMKIENGNAYIHFMP